MSEKTAVSGGSVFAAIDLKSFYASVECVSRGLDPMTSNLVVADAERTNKTICLAVSPPMKQYGLSGRPRLFEVERAVSAANAARCRNAPGKTLRGCSCDAAELEAHPELALDYITAVPRMSRYMEVSAEIYRIYLKYVAPEDIHAYSIDEVFVDLTGYLRIYSAGAREILTRMIHDVLEHTGITATAGIGTNLYLCKAAMDIVAKHIPADENGVRIAELDELEYRRQLWPHRPITDFWRVGTGYASKLAAHGMFTMGDVARCSNFRRGEDLLYKLFGVNAELLIDHAWGWEPCTMADIKAYKPESSGVSSGQILPEPYPFEKALVVVREMADTLALDLTARGLAADLLTLAVGYDAEDAEDSPDDLAGMYGRRIPKPARGSAEIGHFTSSSSELMRAAAEIFERIADRRLQVRRLNLGACRVIPAGAKRSREGLFQPDLFSDFETVSAERERRRRAAEKESAVQKAVLDIKRRYGRNAILKGTNLEEGATGIERNNMIGGHKA